MSQKSSSVNYFIKDAKGLPQLIKVVQPSPSLQQAVSRIQLASGGLSPVFKVPGNPDSSSQTPTLYRAVNVSGLKSGSKLVQVPIQALNQLQKGASGSPAQANAAIKKVQSQSVSGVNKVMQPVPALVQQQQQTSQVKQVQLLAVQDNKNHISPILSHNSRKRRDSDNEATTEYTSKRRKAADKVGKGLRHFSMKVCEKVRKKGFTSYNEVADELVAEFTAGMHGSADSQQYDQKNIRRRVYDALNVLMAMNIISKEKKEIRWLGLPVNSIQECTSLEKEKQIKLDRIQQKTQQLHDLILQQISFKSLVERNRSAESRGLTPSATSAIQLPFIVVNTSDKSLVNCSISNDKMEYMFNFTEKFQIHDDIDILKKMGLLLGLDKGQCSENDLLKAKSMVPKSLGHYVDQLGRGVNIQLDDLLTNIIIKEESDVMEDSSNPDGDEEGDLDGEEDGLGMTYSDDDDDDQDDSSSDVDVN